MSYVKSISVKNTVNKSIAYILNPDKTEDLLYTSSINCVADKDIAYGQFCNVYDRYNYKVCKGVEGKKKPVKAHHFIQSFKHGQVTPELAHQIAKEWARKVFGENRQIVIATHLDKGHVHNHFIVNAVDYNGKKYYANKNTLLRARNIDNAICIEHGIAIIQGNNKKGVQYKEWMEARNGKSWKKNIRLAIDKAVLKVNSIDEFVSVLKEDGYEVKKGKYLSIRAKDKDRYVRTKNLGNDYEEESLVRRMGQKYTEKSILENINSLPIYETNSNAMYRHQNKPVYQGVQTKYVSLIRLVADLIVSGKKTPKAYNHRKPYSVANDYHINELAMHLSLLNKEGITSEIGLKLKYDEVSRLFSDAKTSIDKLSNLHTSLEGVINNTEIYYELAQKQGLSGSESLKLTIAKSVIENYKIQGVEDIAKLKKKRDETISSLNKLKSSFDSINSKYNQFKSLVMKYEEIKNEQYLKNNIQKNVKIHYER